MKNSPFSAEIYAGLNVAIAMVMLFNSKLSVVYSLIILLAGVYAIFKNKNMDGAAHIYAAYVVGIEVLLRMNSGGFGYEYGKYATIVFLVLGILVGKRNRKLPVSFIAFILLLVPSIFFVDYPTFDMSRQMVSFNISGPVTLGIAGIYFYRRRIPIQQLRKTFLAMLYPIIAMSIFVYFRSGSLEDVDFTTESNFQASGGFGPNQVSTMFGLGILIIAAAYFLNIRLFRVKNLNIILLLAFLIRGLATFSRGGMLAPIVAIILCVVIMSVTDASFQEKMSRVVYIFMALFIVSVVGFYYVNEVSGGLLEMRFKGESMYDKEKSNMFSGRLEIFEEDIEVFQDNVLTGVGPGMASEKRAEISGVFAAAHIEYSRLLAEHGLFGIIAILIMVLFPVSTFFKLKSGDEKILLILCSVFVFITLGHAAMRLAAPGFVYGLGFIYIFRKRR